MFLRNLYAMFKIFIAGMTTISFPLFIVFFCVKKDIGPFEYYGLPVILCMISIVIFFSTVLTIFGVELNDY